MRNTFINVVRLHKSKGIESTDGQRNVCIGTDLKLQSFVKGRKHYIFM